MLSSGRNGVALSNRDAASPTGFLCANCRPLSSPSYVLAMHVALVQCEKRDEARAATVSELIGEAAQAEAIKKAWRKSHNPLALEARLKPWQIIAKAEDKAPRLLWGRQCVFLWS